MVESSNFTQIASTITNVLTLRYDPTQKPLLPKLTWKDFTPNNLEPSIDFIERSIENSIKKEINHKEKKISIALSGGVDSTLMLTILKKLNPDIDIQTISIKFADSIDETTKAAKIAEKLGLDHHIVYLENYLAELPKAISIIKLPFWDLHFYHVVKKAQTLSNYLVAGDGGDEIFGGYTFRYKIGRAHV